MMKMETVIKVDPSDALRLAKMLSMADLSDQSDELQSFQQLWIGQLMAFGHFWTLKSCVPAGFWSDYDKAVAQIVAGRPHLAPVKGGTA